ncbi:TIGR03619 family F420-dependent LLM class oxidoreductase [Nocardia seriolae]|uniref:Alkanesulfonate monooxygenase n=1 Tax=Nocardia seriolae TaxID=37332 RepID=A0A0B8NH95_9NOCA|nr:TIGR03619 family F420-dependent LLM class oxidoreductase [Nocardia seriolae]APA99974.1 Alkanesulfonate monooxygenase [Nocardia seriolae]MTJ64656.1 TIGR03619 family F420-dependent LLM class oxidoreductase [Nocardia seriolae]MTJ73033.1 TIGR03619 family F420-dependent LLM class oxidoreductase [Nocardia seriolae]MTJ89499.1 TIGR03619 family F420-dependent LLM class oxidoreductase [Nocardia seriolae]MTK33474.1 TIGR03619 family F420-dependent LLM class oxidoreductase [Nocardia seriolae]
MKYGVNLPNFGPQMTPEGMLCWTREAERVGFDSVLVSDHVALTDDANRRSPAPFFESLSTLAWLAGQTATVRLGTGVLIGSHRHPIDLAHTTATIDALSGGRLIVGVGVGWARAAFDVLGVPFEQRGRITDQVLETLVAAWSAPSIEYPGARSIRRVHTEPRPVQQPHPPLWIGGNGPPAIERVNRFGTAWHPLHPNRATCRHGVRNLKPDTLFAPRVFFLPTAETVAEAGRPLGYGAPHQIREDMEFLRELGADTVVLDTDPGDQRLRRHWREDVRLVRLAAEILEIA